MKQKQSLVLLTIVFTGLAGSTITVYSSDPARKESARIRMVNAASATGYPMLFEGECTPRSASQWGRSSALLPTGLDIHATAPARLSTGTPATDLPARVAFIETRIPAGSRVAVGFYVG